ncbi:hypothetical protein D3C76_1824010 [compost metagenome]
MRLAAPRFFQPGLRKRMGMGIRGKEHQRRLPDDLFTRKTEQSNQPVVYIDQS